MPHPVAASADSAEVARGVLAWAARPGPAENRAQAETRRRLADAREPAVVPRRQHRALTGAAQRVLWLIGAHIRIGSIAHRGTPSAAARRPDLSRCLTAAESAVETLGPAPG